MKVLTGFDSRELTNNELQLVRGGVSLSLPLLNRWEGKNEGKKRDHDGGCDCDRDWGWDDYDGRYYRHYRYYREWRGDDYFGDCD